MELTNKYYQLLLWLEEDPLMSIQDLADKLDVSWVTAKKYYTDLKENNILFNPIANINFPKLSLKRVNVIVTCPNYQSLENLELACRAHPYTNYRSRIIGKQYGLFIVFYIPDDQEAENLLNSYIDLLRDNEWISTSKIFITNSVTLNIQPNLDKYNWELRKWEFDWSNWFAKLIEHDIEDINSEDINPINLAELTWEHVLILNRLSNNGAIKQSDLIRDEELQLSRTEAHRQYNYVNENLIIGYENVYDRSKFNMNDLKLYVVNFDTTDEINQFISYCKQNNPPFRISLQKTDTKQILLWTHMDLFSSQQFSFELFKRYSDIQVYDMVIYSSNSSRYGFWPANFNKDNHSWKNSKEWMIEKPMEYIDENLEDRN